ncbi:MAG: dTDP-glucose 4,6-dehydratase [Methanomassiliicoccales archaeon]|nr:dTDP-glucose 4,6-dehydratase [Methanomassiliicoccales archaeon]
MYKRILVTGGMGFIGSNFIRFMIERHPEIEIINLDKLTYAGNPRNLEDINCERVKFVKGDICNGAIVNDLAAKCDAIVHFAAETHVDRSITSASAFIETDVYGTYVLLEAARKQRVKRFIHISTDEVYGEAVTGPSKETDALMPKSPYAASKAGADRLVFSYYCTYGLPAIITRCTNNYGPFQYPEKLIPLFITNAIENKPLPVYGTGKNTRDWIFVRDHCEAIDLLLHSNGFEGEVFNIGSGEEKSVLEIASVILDLLGKPKELITFVPDRPGHVMRHAVDTRKIRDLTGWKPRYSFNDGIEETINWYRKNESWWKEIKSGEFRKYYESQYATIAGIQSSQ